MMLSFIETTDTENQYAVEQRPGLWGFRAAQQIPERLPGMTMRLPHQLVVPTSIKGCATGLTNLMTRLARREPLLATMMRLPRQRVVQTSTKDYITGTTSLIPRQRRRDLFLATTMRLPHRLGLPTSTKCCTTGTAILVMRQERRGLLLATTMRLLHLRVVPTSIKGCTTTRMRLTLADRIITKFHWNREMLDMSMTEWKSFPLRFI